VVIRNKDVCGVIQLIMGV